MAKSRPASKYPDAPYVRLPHHPRRVSVSFDLDKGRTHQSFKDECDVNKIIDLHARTGVLNHVARGHAQFGDVPDGTFFDHALALSAVSSAEAEGWAPPEEPSEALQEPLSEVTEQGAEAPENAAQA